MDQLLKKSQVNTLIDNLSNNYGYNLDFLKSYYFYVGGRGKIYISKIDTTNLKLDRINSSGIYFGTFHDEERFRLSVEGTQFVKPIKNYVKINYETLKSYLAAENLFKDEVLELNKEENSTFLIVIYENQNIGCVSLKENMLLNYISKSRKLDFNKVF